MKKKHCVNQTSSHIIKYVGELSNQADMQPTVPHSVYQRHLLVKSVRTQTTFFALFNTPKSLEEDVLNLSLEGAENGGLDYE
jgi:hypothetical protein